MTHQRRRVEEDRLPAVDAPLEGCPPCAKGVEQCRVVGNTSPVAPRHPRARRIRAQAHPPVHVGGLGAVRLLHHLHRMIVNYCSGAQNTLRQQRPTAPVVAERSSFISHSEAPNRRRLTSGLQRLSTLLLTNGVGCGIVPPCTHCVVFLVAARNGSMAFLLSFAIHTRTRAFAQSRLRKLIRLFTTIAVESQQ